MGMRKGRENTAGSSTGAAHAASNDRHQGEIRFQIDGVRLNRTVQTGNDESFLNYYARMLDDLRAALPNTAFYVQSVLAATQQTVSEEAPGLAPDRLATINAAIQGLCAERGCYFLDLNAEFSDESGYLLSDYAQPDGVHLTVSGYNKWVSYLCTHVPYNKNNPYQPGSTYYLSDDVKQLLADIP